MKKNSVKNIQLRNSDKVVLVDAEDFDLLCKYKWYLYSNRGSNFYATRYDVKSKPKQIRMHRIIMGINDSNIHLDHINGNGLDNRKSNLRIATNQQNSFNRQKTRKNKSGFKGVFWQADANIWRAQIKVHQKSICLGSYKNKIDAAKAYNEAAKKYFGEFAVLNNV